MRVGTVTRPSAIERSGGHSTAKQRDKYSQLAGCIIRESLISLAYLDTDVILSQYINSVPGGLVVGGDVGVVGVSAGTGSGCLNNL